MDGKSDDNKLNLRVKFQLLDSVVSAESVAVQIDYRRRCDLQAAAFLMLTPIWLELHDLRGREKAAEKTN